MVPSLALLILVASLAQAAVKLTDFVSTCSFKDPKLDDCLKTQAQAILPHYVEGVRDWGILPMDPLKVPHLTIQQGTLNSGGLSFNVTDVSLYGWKDMEVKELKFDPNNYEITLKYNMPVFKVEGLYKVSGQILVLPIQGEGDAKISFKNVIGLLKLNCERETRGKETYLKIAKASSALEITGIIFKLDNLFGNKELSDNMNTVLTENSLEVFRDLQEPLNTILADVMQTVVSRMFKKVPLNQLFKDV